MTQPSFHEKTRASLESPGVGISAGIPLIVGEVLWDCLPSGRILGGAPLNVAWNLQGFGLAPLMASAVGEDEPGHEVLKRMRSWGMNTDAVAVLSDKATGSVAVTLDQGEPHYDILTDVAYDHIPLPDDSTLAPASRASATDGPGVMLYHGSLAYRSPASRATIMALREQFSNNIFVDINIRQPHFDSKWLDEMLPGTHYLKLNVDELSGLTSLETQTEEQRAAAVLSLTNRFETLRAVLVTRGGDGVEYHRPGRETISVGAPKPTPMVDAVGAGDALASVVLAALLRRIPMEEAITDAAAFAARVCALPGATKQDSDFYRLGNS